MPDQSIFLRRTGNWGSLEPKAQPGWGWHWGTPRVEIWGALGVPWGFLGNLAGTRGSPSSGVWLRAPCCPEPQHCCHYGQRGSASCGNRPQPQPGSLLWDSCGNRVQDLPGAPSHPHPTRTCWIFLEGKAGAAAKDSSEHCTPQGQIWGGREGIPFVQTLKWGDIKNTVTL